MITVIGMVPSKAIEKMGILRRIKHRLTYYRRRHDVLLNRLLKIKNLTVKGRKIMVGRSTLSEAQTINIYVILKAIADECYRPWIGDATRRGGDK